MTVAERAARNAVAAHRGARPAASRRSTPTSSGYHDLSALPAMGYSHARINHAERVYVSGDVHTNTIEGFWSLVKRGSAASTIGVSKHLQGYLNEYAWRYNQRHEAARPIPAATSSGHAVPLISQAWRLSSDCRRSRHAWMSRNPLPASVSLRLRHDSPLRRLSP